MQNYEIIMEKENLKTRNHPSKNQKVFNLLIFKLQGLNILTDFINKEKSATKSIPTINRLLLLKGKVSSSFLFHEEEYLDDL